MDELSCQLCLKTTDVDFITRCGHKFHEECIQKNILAIKLFAPNAELEYFDTKNLNIFCLKHAYKRALTMKSLSLFSRKSKALKMKKIIL